MAAAKLNKIKIIEIINNITSLENNNRFIYSLLYWIWSYMCIFFSVWNDRWILGCQNVTETDVLLPGTYCEFYKNLSLLNLCKLVTSQAVRFILIWGVYMDKIQHTTCRRGSFKFARFWHFRLIDLTDGPYMSDRWHKTVLVRPCVPIILTH